MRKINIIFGALVVVAVFMTASILRTVEGERSRIALLETGELRTDQSEGGPGVTKNENADALDGTPTLISPPVTGQSKAVVMGFIPQDRSANAFENDSSDAYKKNGDSEGFIVVIEMPQYAYSIPANPGQVFVPSNSPFPPTPSLTPIPDTDPTMPEPSPDNTPIPEDTPRPENTPVYDNTPKPEDIHPYQPIPDETPDHDKNDENERGRKDGEEQRNDRDQPGNNDNQQKPKDKDKPDNNDNQQKPEDKDKPDNNDNQQKPKDKDKPGNNGDQQKDKEKDKPHNKGN